MSSNGDTAIVMTWLSHALGGDTTPGRRAALARHCGVTPQAVNGWLRTGRISKRHLESAANFLGSRPSFARPDHPGVAEPANRYTVGEWPFRDIDREAVARLDERSLARLEGALILAAAQLGYKIGRS